MPKQKSTHVDDPAAVGRRLREARDRAGLSQRDLAFPGCTAAYISRIEAGARIPSLQILREFGKKLGVSVDFLATGDASAEEKEQDELMELELMASIGDRREARRRYERLAATSETPTVVTA